MKVVRTEVALALDSDHVDLRRVFVDGRLTEFSVNYRIHVDGVWHEVVRYDNCHGGPHVHRYFETEPPVPFSGGRNLEALLESAEADMVENWSAYRKKMVGRIRQLKEHPPHQENP